MAEQLAVANTAYDKWLERIDDKRPDALLTYMAFLGGFQAGHDAATEVEDR
jgi:hypothetical protein